VEKLFTIGSNVNLGKTTDGTSPLLITAQRGHATGVDHLIVSQRRSCIDNEYGNIDPACDPK
jgi:hypothetical protein